MLLLTFSEMICFAIVAQKNIQLALFAILLVLFTVLHSSVCSRLVASGYTTHETVHLKMIIYGAFHSISQLCLSVVLLELMASKYET